MTPLAFLRLPEVRRALELAHQAAALPLSVHVVERGEEGVRPLAFGGCDICRHIVSLPGGVRACRESRSRASAAAIEQSRPLGFVCHAGLSCLSFPLLPGAPFSVTLGPYLPDTVPAEVEQEVLQAISRLTGTRITQLPVALDDVRRVPANAAAATAAWLRDSIARLWTEHGVDPAQREHEEAKPARRSVRPMPVPEAGVPARQIALLLAGGNRVQARKLLLGALEQGAPTGRASYDYRVKGIALASAVLEAAAQANLDTGAAQAGLAVAASGSESIASAPEAVHVVMQALAGLAPGRRQPAPARYAVLDEILTGRLHETITLNEVAARMGESPSAITHRLQRKFGMSFSEYIGRLRVEEAKRLLRRTRLTATQVGEKVGIRDQSYFSKVFKRHEGMSPTDYRQRYGK